MRRSNVALRGLNTGAGVLALLSVSGAGALSLDVSAAYPFNARVGVSDVSLLGGTWGFGVSDRAADASASFGLDLSALGNVSSDTRLAALYGGGYRLGTAAQAALGPVALNLNAGVWNVAATAVDPLAAWGADAVDNRSGGGNFGLSGRYRVSRELVVTAGGNLGGQSQATLNGEWRGGAFSYRLGGRAGQGVLGLTTGISWRASDAVTLQADALIGPGDTDRGLTGSLNLADVVGEGSALRVYGAYEPWRAVAATVRYGAELTLPTATGALSLEARGTSGAAGARVAYRYDFPTTP